MPCPDIIGDICGVRGVVRRPRAHSRDGLHDTVSHQYPQLPHVAASHGCQEYWTSTTTQRRYWEAANGRFTRVMFPQNYRETPCFLDLYSSHSRFEFLYNDITIILQ